MISCLLFKIASCIIPAFIGSSVITPISTIVDVAVVKSAHSGGIIHPLLESGKEFKFDELTGLTFVGGFSTLAATNIFIDELVKTGCGVGVNVAFSVWKDNVIMGGNLSKRTRLLFIMRDMLSIYPSIKFQDLCIYKKLILVFLFQIPCTILNSLAMDNHIYRCRDNRNTRVRKTFVSNLPVRFLKSAIGSNLASQINYSIIKRF